MPISAPVENVKRKLARRLFESVVTQIPFVEAPVVATFSVTRPPQAEIAIDKWRGDATDQLNQLEEAISELLPTFKISDDGANLAVHLARMCDYGTGFETFDLQRLNDSIPGSNNSELVELCGELESLELMETTGAIGAEIVRVRPTITLFEIFDEVAIGHDPRKDAMVLADYLSNNKELSSHQYTKNSGWRIRRYNPAMAIVCQMIGEGRISKMKSREYFSRSCTTTPQERAVLRRFAASISGSTPP